VEAGRDPPERRRALPLGWRVAAAFLLGQVGVLAFAVLARDELARIAGAAGATLVGFAALRWALRPVRRTLPALRDGVRSFDDRDFSLRLVAPAEPVLGALVTLYNRIGEALHRERGRALEREVLFEAVLQASPMATLLVSGDRVVFANRAARELLADEREPRLEGRRFSELLAERPAALREAVAGSRDALFEVDVGHGVETFHVARRHFDLGGRRHELVLVRRLTVELHRQEVAAWKRAIQMMSHEINNSLAPIASLARSARRLAADGERPAGQSRLDGALEVIEDRAAHLARFLEGYARFARLPAPQRREVEWGPFVDELRELYSFRLAAPLPGRAGWCDAAQLQQAVINLLKNAHEAGGDPAAVELAVEPTGDGGTRLRVRDRGAGMSDDELRQAVLPFYTSKPAGSGLGLPLTREIVEAHGGHLRIERREGGGTEVVLWLPGRG
jgi:nitrogen fixation/metabolism regulation signal transduction histidine kinase